MGGGASTSSVRTSKRVSALVAATLANLPRNASVATIDAAKAAATAVASMGYSRKGVFAAGGRYEKLVDDQRNPNMERPNIFAVGKEYQ